MERNILEGGGSAKRGRRAEGVVAAVAATEIAVSGVAGSAVAGTRDPRSSLEWGPPSISHLRTAVPLNAIVEGGEAPNWRREEDVIGREN